MCMGGGDSGPSGPTAAQLEQQQRQEEEHQQQLALIQEDRDRASAQAQALQKQQEEFAKQQNDYMQQLALATAKAAAKTAPAAPLAPGTVATGADEGSGNLTDDAANSLLEAKKRGRAALRIDLTSPTGQATGLNIPIG